MRLISVGEFKDKLGSNALAIAISVHPICVALKELLYDRQVVDLDSPRLYEYLMLLANNSLPEADPNFPNSGPLTEEQVKLILDIEPPSVGHLIMHPNPDDYN